MRCCPPLLLAALTLTAACAGRPQSGGTGDSTAIATADSGNMASATQDTMNTLTAAEKDSGWRLLFDGKTIDQWRGYKSDSVPSGWSVQNGVLTKTGSSEDIVSRDSFANFEVTFDWKLPPGGNAGFFYHGTEEYDHIYWSAPEYQLLDDAGHPDGKNRLTAAGSDYGLYPSPAGTVHPAGEWNSSRIVVNGAHVEHWMNGQKLLEYTLWSPDWKQKVAKSKFADYPDYGMAHRGLLGIQGDHDGTLELRNIKVRELK